MHIMGGEQALLRIFSTIINNEPVIVYNTRPIVYEGIPCSTLTLINKQLQLFVYRI